MIVDAVSFYNELDFLELRMSELEHVVDRFVVVEANRTHKGTLKPLYFAENRARFAQWEKKITHIVCPLMGDGDGLPAIRRREMTQRNAILQGVLDCADDDVILISDCDEIPRIEAVVRALEDGMVVTYLQRLHYYNFNTYAPERVWPGTRACRVSDARALSPHVIRNGLAQPDGVYPIHRHIVDAGWHFSYFGGVEKIQAKMTEFLHQELVTGENTSEEAIQARVSSGTDIWGREYEQSFQIGPADDLPYTVLRDLDKYLPHFHPDWRPTFHENWYDGGQAIYVGDLARQAPEGAIVEIGAWEGRSTTVLAQMVAPRVVHVVDTWRGNEDEDVGHVSVVAAAERDVFKVFEYNTSRITSGNVCIHRQSWQEWARWWEDPKGDRCDYLGVAFLHLDASHDRASVRDCLEAVRPFLVPGAILCGDDAYDERVIAGVRDVFPEAEVIGERLWKV